MAQPEAEPIVLRGHEGDIFALAFSPDGEWLATGSEDNTARLWNVAQPEAEPIVLRGHENLVRALAFSPDGEWLATGSSDNTARLWNVAQPEAEPIVLRGHENWVIALAFSPDGEWLATGSSDNTARLWNVAQPEAEPIVLRGHENLVRALAFSPDGEWLATGSEDNTARLWRQRLNELIDIACGLTGQNLGWADWQRYFGSEEYQIVCQTEPVPLSVATAYQERAKSLAQRNDLAQQKIIWRWQPTLRLSLRSIQPPTSSVAG